MTGRLKAISRIIDILLYIPVAPVKENGEPNGTGNRPDSQIEKTISNYIKKLRTFSKINRNVFKYILDPLCIHFISNIVRKIAPRDMDIMMLLESANTMDLLNAVSYVYIFVIFPFVNRDKTIAQVTGKPGEYVSWTFPTCRSVALKYFIEHAESTRNGLVILHGILVRIDPRTLSDSVYNLLNDWVDFKNNSTHIKIPVGGFINIVKPSRENGWVRKTTSGALRMVTEPLCRAGRATMECFLRKTYEDMGITGTFAYSDRSNIYIPNIFNDRIRDNDTASGFNVRNVLSISVYFIILVANLIYDTPQVLQLLQGVGLPSVYRWVTSITDVSIATVPNSICMEEIMRKYFGITGKYNNKISINGRLNMNVVIMYVKLVTSALYHKNTDTPDDSLRKITGTLCNFYKSFQMDGNIVRSVNDTRLLIHILSMHFKKPLDIDIKIPPYIRLNGNELTDTDIQRIIAYNTNNPEFVSIVSLYVTVLNLLQVYNRGTSTIESLLLEISVKKTERNVYNRNSIHLIGRDGSIISAIKHFVTVTNLPREYTGKTVRSSRSRLYEAIYSEHFIIPRRLWISGSLALLKPFAARTIGLIRKKL